MKYWSNKFSQLIYLKVFKEKSNEKHTLYIKRFDIIKSGEQHKVTLNDSRSDYPSYLSVLTYFPCGWTDVTWRRYCLLQNIQYIYIYAVITSEVEKWIRKVMQIAFQSKEVILQQPRIQNYLSILPRHLKKAGLYHLSKNDVCWSVTLFKYDCAVIAVQYYTSVIFRIQTIGFHF